MNKKTGKIFNFIIIIMVSIFIFGVNLSFAVSNIIDSKMLIKPAEINNENTADNLLKVANVKLEIANEKEAAYDKAINQTKLYVTFFGSFLILVAIAFGFYKNNQIVEAKDELLQAIEEKKKTLEENNSVNMEKKMFELEKNNSVNMEKKMYEVEENNLVKIEEIRKLTLSNIEDLQKRVRFLEGGKRGFENKNTEEMNEGCVSSENKNPYE